EAVESRGWDGWVHVVQAGRNGGFAAGNNVGIRWAMDRSMAEGGAPDFVLLLNPDTVVRPGAIREMLAFMDARPQVGICGCSLEDGAGVVQHTAHRFPSPLGELDRGARLGLLRRMLARHVDAPPQPGAEPVACDWVSGASMLVRRRVFDTIGLMDEGFFLYYEDVDFCARAVAAKFGVAYVPSARVLHVEGQSTGIARPGAGAGEVRARRAPYWYGSRRRFFVKRYGVWGLIKSDVLWAIGRLTFVVRRALRLGSGGPDSDPARFARDLLGGDLRAV